MKTKTRIITAIMAIVLVIGAAIPAFADNFTVYFTGDIVNVSELKKGDIVNDGDLIWNDVMPKQIYFGKANQNMIDIVAESNNSVSDVTITSDGVSTLLNNNAKSVMVDEGFCYVLDASAHNPERTSGGTTWVVLVNDVGMLVLRAVA